MRQELAALVDRRAPVRALRADAEAEEAEGAEEDGGVADPQAGIDDQRAAGVGQDLPHHDVPGPLAAGLRGGDIVAGLDVEGEAADDAEDRRRGDEDHGEEDVERVRLHRQQAGRVPEAGQPEIAEAADERGPARGSTRAPPAGRGSGSRGRAQTKTTGKMKKHRRHRAGDRGLADLGRDQEVEEQDHREGQHEVREEAQHGVEPAADVAGGQPEGDPDHVGEERREGRDRHHRPAAVDHAAEDVAPERVAAEEEGQPALGVDRPGRLVLQRADLHVGIEDRDPVAP